MVPLIKPAAWMIDKRAVDVAFVLDGERHPVAIGRHGGTLRPLETPAPAAYTESGGATVEVPLIRLAWARSGDKGNLSNIGLIARQPSFLPLLWKRVTPEVVKGYFAHLVEGEVERYHLPGIDAINYLLHDALDGGGMASRRIDPLGKGMAQMLLDLKIAVPIEIAAAA